MRTIRHIVIRGTVQGVGYRAWVAGEAHRRGLEGWVRNRRDGTVEAVFAGAEEAVEAMVAACRRGPPAARVDTVADSAASDRELAQRQPGETFSALPTL